MSALAIGGLVLDLVRDIFKNNKEKRAAKHEAALAEISEGQGYQNGWKDEYLTVVFSFPVVMEWWQVLVGEQTPKAAVENLGQYPLWYQTILLTIVIGSFGLRAYREAKKHGNKV